MKRPNSTTLRRHAGFIKAENIEKELKKIREELAWMRTEQKEMECWIHVALRDLGSLCAFLNNLGTSAERKSEPQSSSPTRKGCSH